MMPKDLVLLVADKNIHYGIRGLLSRPRALGIRPITAEIYVHPRRDPACARESHNFLRPFLNNFTHAVVMFDRVGSGRDEFSSEELSAEVEQSLATNGWGNRAEAVVLDPELEVWVFSPSPHVEGCLGWRRGNGDLRRWLEHQNLWNRNQPKPDNPREVLDKVLFKIRTPRSASLFECLGQRVSLRRCADPSFRKFRNTLVRWFPP